ncbi:MAG: LON peptidase substrate-binding domain-containing protein [Phycisphaeraceae bacterium]|nr:LON peptidase substrate-binding domain-containing protein [Phycisphaeraceae bacterium]
MAETLTIDFSVPVPLFPLPQCVLLPHATIPLHIFEPRYRQMVKDALDSRGLIAMASFDNKDWKSLYDGSPTLREHICLGYIIRHESLTGGKYNILLQGVCRARITKEIEADTLYRQALIEPTERRPPLLEIDLVDQRESLEALLADPLLKELTSVNAIHNWLTSEIPTSALIDLATMTMCESTEQRYSLLAEPDVLARAEWLEKLLRQTRHTLKLAQNFRPKDCPDGVNLN